jgi:hypothetical protein
VVISSPSGSWLDQVVSTGSSGYFAVTALPPCHYQIAVDAPGYAPTSKQDLQVMVDWRIRANQRMAPQSASTGQPAPAVAIAKSR